MTIEWVDLEEAHIDQLIPHTAQLKEWMVENRKDCLKSIIGKTMVVDGVPLVIGGIWPQWENRYYFWAMFDQRFDNRYSRDVIRGMRVFLEGAPTGRIECAVNFENAQIVKMLKLMGFALEGILRYYYSWGDDAFMCSYIKRS